MTIHASYTPPAPRSGRQRVLDACDHRPVDRIPIDCSGHRSSGIAAVAYARLRKHLGLPERTIRVYDPIQQLAILDEDVLERFGVDTVELGRAFCHEDEHWAAWTLPDGTPCEIPAWALPRKKEARGVWELTDAAGEAIAEMPVDSYFFEQTVFPWVEREPDYDRMGEEIAGALGRVMWCAVATPSGGHASKLTGESTSRELASAFRASTNRAICGLFGGNLLEMGQFLYRNDNFFMLLASEPAKAHAFLDALVEMHLANLEAYLERFGEFLDVIVFGDDLGMQNGPQISPEMYRAFFKPRHARMWQRVHERAPHIKVNLHCCGGVEPLLEDLIDAGLDAINPVQISCRDMALDHLADRFGGRLCFWGGGCDTRDVLPNATPAEVREHVLRQCEVFGKRGGFVFQQVHNIMPNVPPQNIVAMFDAVAEASGDSA